MDLVNLNNEEFVNQKRESYSDENLFSPDPKKGKNGVYKAGIRFIPWWKNPKENMYKKYQAILTHPFTKEKLFAECPSTLRQSSILWDLDTLLRNKVKAKQDEQIVKDIKVNFNRYMNVYAPVYIIKDLQDSSIDGTIKIYPFGFTILQQIENKLKPESLGLGAVQAIDPFSLTAGLDFQAIVSMKTKSYKDYSKCLFVNTQSPFIFKYNGQVYTVTDQMLAETAQSNETPLAKFLIEKTPNMDAYKFKAWTPELRAKIADYIIAIVQYPSIMQELLTTTKDIETKDLIISKIKERQQMTAGLGGVGMPQATTAPIVNTQTNQIDGMNLGTVQPVEEKQFVFDMVPEESLTNPSVTTPVVNQLETELNSVSTDASLTTPIVEAPPVQAKNVTPPAGLEDTNFKSMLDKL